MDETIALGSGMIKGGNNIVLGMNYSSVRFACLSEDRRLLIAFVLCQKTNKAITKFGGDK